MSFEAAPISWDICALEQCWVIVAIYQNDMSRPYSKGGQLAHNLRRNIEGRRAVDKKKEIDFAREREEGKFLISIIFLQEIV